MRILIYTSRHGPLDPRIEQKFASTLSRQHIVYVQNSKHKYLYALRGRLRRDLKYTKVRHKKFDVVQLNDPLDFLLPTLLTDLKLAKCSYVLDFHENLAQQILHKEYLGYSRHLISFLSRGALWWFKHSSVRKIAATKSIFNSVSADVKIKNTSLIEVDEYARLDDVNRYYDAASPNNTEVRKSERQNINFVYLGRVTSERGAVAMTLLMTNFPSATLHIFGSLKRNDKDVESLLSMKNVRFWGYYDASALSHKIAPLERVIGLCMLKPLPNYLDSFPTKICDYFALGVPVLATKIPSWIDAFGTDGIEYCSYDAHVSELKAAVQSLATSTQRPPRDKFCWRADDESKLLKFYGSLEGSNEV